MPSVTKKIADKGLIHPPTWLPDNVHYETIVGSVAYGISSDTSDMDIIGFGIPPKEIVFPHLAGEIIGFGEEKQRFREFESHGVVSKDELGGSGRKYDFKIYNIVQFLNLLRETNPNLIDSLFTAEECVLHITQVGAMVREQRKMFLNKKCWHTYKGYAYKQLHKMSTKEPTGKRIALREEFGFDVKFAYNVVRLLYECEMILTEGDIDLRRHREHLKSIKRGEVPEEEIRNWASSKEKQLEQMYDQSTLPWGADESKIKTLLIQCLEHHYGSLAKCVVIPNAAELALDEIKTVLDRYGMEAGKSS